MHSKDPSHLVQLSLGCLRSQCSSESLPQFCVNIVLSFIRVSYAGIRMNAAHLLLGYMPPLQDIIYTVG